MFMSHQTTFPDGTKIESGGSCTCLLTDDSKLVTAKHWISSLLFGISDLEDILLNRAYPFKNFEIKINIEAFSPDGRKMH